MPFILVYYAIYHMVKSILKKREFFLGPPGFEPGRPGLTNQPGDGASAVLIGFCQTLVRF